MPADTFFIFFGVFFDAIPHGWQGFRGGVRGRLFRLFLVRFARLFPMAREDLAEASRGRIFVVFDVFFDAIPNGWQGFRGGVRGRLFRLFSIRLISESVVNNVYFKHLIAYMQQGFCNVIGFDQKCKIQSLFGEAVFLHRSEVKITLFGSGSTKGTLKLQKL